MRSKRIMRTVPVGSYDRSLALEFLRGRHDEPCKHGHLSCSTIEGGRCLDETMANAIERGWINEAGDVLPWGGSK